jgi:TPR repeat protein
MYANGQGVPQDYKAAVKWYRLAAERGNAVAQFNLGVSHNKGQGVPQDPKAAVKWYRLAAEQGKMGAQFNLGVMYANGQGVPQYLVYSHMWTNLAASSGNKQATKFRNLITKNMTPAQISTAQRLATECAEKIRKKVKGGESKH